jgi:hypothetical protein
VRWQLDTGREFIPAQTVTEWVDDRIARCPVADGAPSVVGEMFEMLRGGGDAVPGAVDARTCAMATRSSRSRGAQRHAVTENRAPARRTAPQNAAE